MRSIKPILQIGMAWLCLALTGINFHKVKFVYDGDTILLENGYKIR